MRSTLAAKEEDLEDLEQAAAMTLDDNSSDSAVPVEPATDEDIEFMRHAQEAAKKSKDPKTKVGYPESHVIVTWS